MSEIEKKEFNQLLKNYNKKLDDILIKINSIVNNGHFVFCRNCGKSFIPTQNETICNNCKNEN